MTALPQYDLLEAIGLYFDGQVATPREVIVKFGDASLMVLDTNDMPVTHWPLATLRNVAGAGTALSLTPDQTGAERLSVDDPSMIEALRAVCPDLDAQRPIPRKRWRKIAIWGAAAILSVYLIVFHLIPSLSNQLAELIPPDAEIAMGEAMSGKFAQLITGFEDPNYCANPEGARALSKLTTQLEMEAGVHVPLNVQVLEHKMTNAFALPGGQIVITSGLLALADTPEEVAGVLAHEIGHVAHRDPTRLTLRSAGVAGILGVFLGDFTGAGATVALSEALLSTGYQREAEAAADEFAFELMMRQGLPTTPFASFFLKLGEQSGETPTLLTHLASHPDLKRRAAKATTADTIGENTFEPALSDQQWVALRGICR
jgi:Zn-dependent protease with chaperone function